MSDCRHKVTVRPWRVQETAVTRTCENCGDEVTVMLPSPPPEQREQRGDWQKHRPRRRGNWRR